MPSFINILAAPGCFVDSSNAPVPAGTLSVTPSSEFRMPGSTQAVREPVHRTITNGGMVGTLQLPDPSQTSPQGVGFTFLVRLGNTVLAEYANVLLVADEAGNFDLAVLNTGQFVQAVPQTVISIGSIGGTGAGGNTVTVTAGASAVSLYTVVALVGGAAVTATSGNMAAMGAVIGLAIQSGAAESTFIVQTSGEVDFTGWSWTPDLPIYLGSSGNLTQSPSNVGFIQCMGVAKSPTAVLLSLQPPIAIQ